MLSYAFNVSTVSQAGLRAVVGIGLHASNLIVCRIAISKAVGHKHIEHIGVGEAYAVTSCFFATEKFVLYRFLGLAQFEVQVNSARLGTIGIHVDEQVVGRVQTYQAINCHAGILCGNFGIANSLAINHELYRWYSAIKSRVPVRRLNAVHL